LVDQFYCSIPALDYSNQLKRKPFIGNLTVAFLTGLSIYAGFGFLLPKVELLCTQPMHFFCFFPFPSLDPKRIIKDIEDRPGGPETSGAALSQICNWARKTKDVIFLICNCFISAIWVIIPLSFNNPSLFYYFGGLANLFHCTFMYKSYQGIAGSLQTKLSLFLLKIFDALLWDL